MSAVASNLDDFPDALITLSADGHVLSWNLGADATFGYSAEEAVGRKLQDLVLPPDHAHEVDAETRDVLQRGSAVYEAVRRRKDGTLIHVYVSAQAIRDEQGQLRYVALSQKDVSRLKYVREAQLLESRFRALLDAAPDAMVIVNREGRIVLVNAQAEQLFGYGRLELLGERVELLVPGRFHAGHQARRSGYHEDPRPRPMGEGPELYACRKDGTEFPVEISLSAIETDVGKLVMAAIRDASERRRIEARFRELQGKVLGYEGMLAGISEQKAAQAELERQRQGLVQTEKVAAMASLMAGVAHELNNPLSVVLGQAALLERAAAGGPLAARAAKISAAAERCGRIVTNFLALARQRPPERRQADLAAVVRDALELLAYPLRTDSIDVELALAADLPPLWADPHQLQQVVVNLVTNARQAMRGRAGPRMLVISARSLPGAGSVVLEISDTGPGIPAEVQQRLFEPFFTTKAVGEGTGLGLSLCRGIVEGHGGSISFSSESGLGATFRVELKVEAVPAAALALPVDAAAPTPSPGILVVDDEPEVAEVVAETLREFGQTADVALTATAALDALARKSYGLILSDVKMPEMDGPALFGEVTRRNPALAARFLFLTGDSLSADVAAFLRESGVASLSKPFTSDELMAAVRATLVR